jgi:hypothetical protein
MPGKRCNDNGYSYITQPALYRVVSADDVDLASVPVLDLSVGTGDKPISEGVNTVLQLGVLMGVGAVAASLKVYVDMFPMLGGAEVVEPEDWEGRWVFVAEREAQGSEMFMLKDIHPSKVKVRVTNLLGTGNLYLVASRTE